jgi:arginase
MKARLIQVPYHLGHERVGMGLGPAHLINAGIAQILSDQGHTIEVETVHLTVPFKNEIQAVINLNNRLKEKVYEAHRKGYFPFILGGNCNTVIGTLAGLNIEQIGVIWLDAHGDYNTPEITLSGFFDGMPLAITTGQCYKEIWNKIAIIKPIFPTNVIHIGSRDLDPKEEELLNNTGVNLVRAEEINHWGIEDSLISKFEQLRANIDQCYLHIDIDVIDPDEAPGVDFRSPNGLSSEKVEKIIHLINQYFKIRAAAITAYNPANDNENKTLQVGLRLIHKILDIISTSSRE